VKLQVVKGNLFYPCPLPPFFLIVEVTNELPNVELRLTKKIHTAEGIRVPDSYRDRVPIKEAK